MSFYRPHSLLAAVNPLCKSIDLNGITPEKEEFQAQVWKVLFKFTVLHGTNARRHSRGPPQWQGQAGGTPGNRLCPRAHTEQVQRSFAGRDSAAWPRALPPLTRRSARSPGLGVCHRVIAAQGNTSELFLIAGIHLRGDF